MAVGLCIWEPRWSRKDCPVLVSKVKSDDTLYEIYFSRYEPLRGKKYLMTGQQIREHGPYERTKQGNKEVYAIPMDILETFKQEK